MEREYKTFAEIKLLDADAGGFEGYASLFGVKDDGGDVVEPGAFKNTLPTFLRDGFISLGHDWEGLSIGTISDAHEDARGLFLRAEYHSTALAQDARKIAAERMARNKSVGLSIGYAVRPGGGASFADDGLRHLLDLNLYEVAQVNVPMLRPAGLTGVKGTPYGEHGDRVLDAVRDYVSRSNDRLDLLRKEGRVLSEANRQKLRDVLEALGGLDAIRGALGDLLTATEPKSADVVDAWALYAEFQKTLAARHCVAA